MTTVALSFLVHNHKAVLCSDSLTLESSPEKLNFHISKMQDQTYSFRFGELSAEVVSKGLKSLSFSFRPLSASPAAPPAE